VGNCPGSRVLLTELVIKRMMAFGRRDPNAATRKPKLGLALALSDKPELLLLDEPTSGPDPVIRHDVLGELMLIIQDERRSV